MPNVHLINSQAGVIGDNTHVEGGIHFHREIVIYEGVKPVSVGALLDACQAQVKNVLDDAQHKYSPDLYVNRAIERELKAFFDTHPLENHAPNCFVIVAPAGSGKTNLLCNLAYWCAFQQPVLLLMGNNTYLGGNTGLLGTIKRELEDASKAVAFRSAGDSLHTLHSLAENLNHDALIFLDAINEYGQPAAMRQALEDIIRKTRGQRIKLIVTCRDYYWGLFKGSFWEGVTVNDLPSDEDKTDTRAKDFSLFTSDEHERALNLYLKHYAIKGRPIGDAVKQCRHPLLLRFFCEAYQGQKVGKMEDIRHKELFGHYWDRKLISIADRMIKQGDERLQDGLVEEVGNYLLDVAAYMLHNNVRAITLSEMSQATQHSEQYNNPRSIYGRIRDEFIILEEKQYKEDLDKEDYIVFVYEEFMEYVMARSLLRDWNRDRLNEKGILSSIEELAEKYTEFAQILGVMVYLAVMLEEDRDIALWHFLLKKGRHWDQVILEGICKLKKDRLDKRFYDVLDEMLTVSDRKTQRKVLDVLEIEKIRQGIPLSMADSIFLFLKNVSGETLWQPAVRLLGHIWKLPGLAQLGDRKVENRLTSIDILLQHLDKKDKIIYPLIAVLKYDKKWQVREKAAEALAGIDDPRVVESMIDTLMRDKSLKVRKTVAEVLTRLGEQRGIAPMITALEHDESPKVREAAARALACLGDQQQAVELLIAKLESDKDWQVREMAAESLIRRGDQRALEPLIAALEDVNLEVRKQAIKGLRVFDDRRAVKPLLDLLLANSLSVADVLSSQALHKTAHRENLFENVQGNGRYVPFEWESKEIRCQAVQALGALGDERAILPLINVMSGDPTMLKCVSQALGDIWRVPALTQLGSNFWDDWRKVSGLLRRLNAEHSVRLLIALIKNNNPDTRYKAAQKLKELEATCALQPFIETLKDSDWRMQEIAAQALGILGNKWAAGQLISVLKDENSHWRVRCAVAEALGKLQDIKAVKSLSNVFDSRCISVQMSAVHALVKLCETPDRRSYVLQHLNKSWQLTNWPQLMEGGYRDRMKAIKLLASLTDSLKVVPLALGLEDGSKNVQLTAVKVLKIMESIPAKKLLDQYGYE